MVVYMNIKEQYYAITKKYLPLMHTPRFFSFEGADHSFNKKEDILYVLKLTYEFFLEA